MDDPRDVFLRHVRSKRGFCVNQEYSVHIKESLINVMFYVIADYINCERESDELGVGKLERLHSYPLAFLESENPREWLEQNRSTDDLGLIMFIYDNVFRMTQGKHRRTLLYIINILDFDL
jgi:hypothetical protein